MLDRKANVSYFFSSTSALRINVYILIDAGPDPDWDPVTNTYTGYDKHNRVRPPRATVTSSSTPPSSAADNPPPQQS